MWQPVTNHEEAWEYWQAGLLWFGPDEEHMDTYTNWPVTVYEHDEFIRLCEGTGTIKGFSYPNFIYIEA